MSKCYNIIFNSRKGTWTNRADITYSFDFNNIPNGQYKATFNYHGETNGTLSSVYRVPLVYINLGKTNDYEAGDTTGSFKYVSSTFLGTLFPFVNSVTSSYLLAKHSDNPPVYITSLANNQVNIKVVNSEGALWTDTNSVTAPLNHYVLVLHLELIKEYDMSLTKQIEQKINESDEYEYQEVEENYEEMQGIPKIFESS